MPTAPDINGGDDNWILQLVYALGAIAAGALAWWKARKRPPVERKLKALKEELEKVQGEMDSMKRDHGERNDRLVRLETLFGVLRENVVEALKELKELHRD